MEEVSPDSDDICVKEEEPMEDENMVIKIERGYIEKDHHRDHKNLDKTEFSLQNCHYDEYNN